MKIGFFDSGLGGQVVMDDFRQYYPDIEMILEMDRTNAPYGGRPPEEIRELTYGGVQRLFERGVDVVILACNTASVHALRWLQTEAMVGKHILGVTVPGAEAVVEGGYKKVGVLATQATIDTAMYTKRIHLLDPSVTVEEIAAPGLVPLIEQGTVSGNEIGVLLREYLSKFSPDIEALVLGCTHYPLVRESIEDAWCNLHQKTKYPLRRGDNGCCGYGVFYNEKLAIIDPGKEAARKIKAWMERKREG